MILVFDLDDTLYEEVTFVQSGFRAVARYLYSVGKIDPAESFKLMMKLLKERGRGAIFNELLREYHLLSAYNLKKCISIYRTHIPDILLPQTTVMCLERFRDVPKYVVTDGHKVVQYNKVKALGLEKYFRKIFITHRYGIANAKPSIYCFERIREKEKVTNGEIVYIGDNPKKDFINLKKNGFRTVRILKGDYSHLVLPDEYEAETQIHSLEELDRSFFQKLKLL